MKRLLSTYLLLCFLSVAVAQEAVNGWVISNVHGPSQIGIVDTIPVDLNKDGLMDVVSASYEDGNLRAYINQGNLKFEQQYISTEVFGAFRVTSTDFNNDGETDFLIPSIETQEIIAIIADPQSKPYGYRKKIIAEGVLLPTDAQAGDFNNDGLMDVASISFEENALLLHIQKLQGEFETILLSKAPQNPRKIVVEDFNNDDVLDILVASEEDNSVRLFNGVDGASFNESLISNQMTGIRFIAKCDVTNADFPDFIAGVSGGNQVVFFANEQNNAFGTEVIDSDLPGANAMHCADTDGDQAVELIGMSSTLGNVYHYQLGKTVTKTLIANNRDGYANLSFADFDNGAAPKVITQAFFESRNLLLDPLSENNESVVWEDFPEGASKVLQTDINNDGINDIVLTSFRDDRIQWYDGRNNQHHIIANNIDGAADLVVGDFDQDGFIDIVSAASFGNKFFLHINNKGFNFETSVLFDGAMFANSLALTDFDQDGWLDVVGSSATDDRLRWFKFGSDQLEVFDLGSPGDAPNDVELGDIDNDGDVDIVVVNFFSGEVVFYQNDGNENFTLETISSGWSRPYAALLRSNANNDLLNVLVTMSMDNQVIDFIQTSFQNFQENLLFSDAENPRKTTTGVDVKELFVTFPNDGDVLSIQEGFKAFPIVKNYFGLSDINRAGSSSKLFISSIDLNVVSVLNKDLIFSSGFND